MTLFPHQGHQSPSVGFLEFVTASLAASGAKQRSSAEVGSQYLERPVLEGRVSHSDDGARQGMNGWDGRIWMGWMDAKVRESF